MSTPPPTSTQTTTTATPDSTGQSEWDEFVKLVGDPPQSIVDWDPDQVKEELIARQWKGMKAGRVQAYHKKLKSGTKNAIPHSLGQGESRKRIREDLNYTRNFIDSHVFALKVNTNSIPTEFSGPAAAYANSRSDEEAFIELVVNALQIVHSGDTKYKLPKLWWGQGLIHVARALAKQLRCMDLGLIHCSNVLVGMKGVGKTSLVKQFAITAALLSPNTVSVYYDVSNSALSPVEIIHTTFELAGIITGEVLESMSHVANFMHDKELRLLLVLDEAQKLYCEEDVPLEQKQRSVSYIRQLSEICSMKGCMVVLCGSSSKLAVLALRHSGTIEMATQLLRKYPGYDSLNDQKFRALSLNALWEEMDDFHKFLLQQTELTVNANLNVLWQRSGGSLRCIVRNLSLPSIMPPPLSTELLVLDCIVQCQPPITKTDLTKLQRVGINVLQQSIEQWRREGGTKINLSDIYTMIDMHYVSAYFSATGQVESVGFSHPKQYEYLCEQDVPGVTLTRYERSILASPITFGKHLEMFVESCIARKNLPVFVLCVNNKPSPDIGEPHTDIMLQDWRPLAKHKDITVYKISPDDYGIDVLKIGVVEASDKGVKSVTFEKHQFKLGCSELPAGKETKKDSAKHAVKRVGLSSELDTLVGRAYGASTVASSVVFIVTWQLGPMARNDLRGIKADDKAKSKEPQEPVKQLYTLYDSAYLLANVWPPNVKDFIRNTGIEWITKNAK